MTELPEGAARPYRVDIRRGVTLGATTKCPREVFPCGFLHHVEDFGPSHHYTLILTAGVATSAAAAKPQIKVAGGGAALRDLRG